ncbi:MAG: asparagine synthase (glutamine-hydrolyzing) [Planctomycetes bacterium]|nr:asparagine synthase (glutamine-hydrolyzing) [Planctomycetota bacterium]
MCGISGIVRLGDRPIPDTAIKHMCDAIAHRGPDDAGYAFFKPGRGDRGRGGSWYDFTDAEFRHLNEHLPVFHGEYCRRELEQQDSWVALGHRRLSILDLTHKGHQPMATPDQRYWVVYNGEIYNFRELRERLESRGYTFSTRTDTEVLLHLWEEFGEASLGMLNGMFALAIYDRLDNELVLARDRFGVKPLYYAITPEHFVFGSEAKGILASGLVEARIDPASLVEYFTFQNLYGDKTLWHSIKLLEPGHYLRLRPGLGEEPRMRRYFEGFSAVDSSLREDPGSIPDRVAESFRSAVQRQLVSDVPVGSYLSGGMDSGSIVAVAGREIPRMHTFTGGFDLTNVNGLEQGFDERREAERLSYLLQTEHYDVVLHAGDMPAAMDKITWHMDDPRVGMCHQVWYVAKLASRFVKVCLAGTGGDELFAGYPWRYRLALQGVRDPEWSQRYFDYWHRLLPRGELPALFAPDLRRWLDAPRHSFDAVVASAPDWRDDLSDAENLLQRSLHFEFKTFLNGLLVTEDKISMAHSMESRVPFLDNEFADLAWSLPPNAKLHMEKLAKTGDAHIDSAEGKLCLRRAMESVLPREFLHQQKQGFSPPDENWYRGPSMAYIKEILLDKQTLDRPWFDTNFVRAKLDEHFEGKRNHRLLVWSLLSVEWIQRHFVDASGVRAPSAVQSVPLRNLREREAGR